MLISTATQDNDIHFNQLSITKLQEQEKKHSVELQNVIAEFAEVREQEREFDEIDVIDYSLAVRDAKKAEYYGWIEKESGKHYYHSDAVASLADADNMLGCSDSSNVLNRINNKTPPMSWQNLQLHSGVLLFRYCLGKMALRRNRRNPFFYC